jgi:hypothetical protein
MVRAKTPSHQVRRKRLWARLTPGKWLNDSRKDAKKTREDFLPGKLTNFALCDFARDLRLPGKWLNDLNRSFFRLAVVPTFAVFE